MAVKKLDSSLIPEEAEAPKKVASSDPWKKMEKIRLLKKEDGSPNYVIASVNGRVFKIKRGDIVEVPAPIAEVIQHSENAEAEASAFMESKAE